MNPLCNIRNCARPASIRVPGNLELGLEDDYLCPACLLALATLMERRADYLRQLLRGEHGRPWNLKVT